MNTCNLKTNMSKKVQYLSLKCGVEVQNCLKMDSLKGRTSVCSGLEQLRTLHHCRSTHYTHYSTHTHSPEVKMFQHAELLSFASLKLLIKVRPPCIKGPVRTRVLHKVMM